MFRLAYAGRRRATREIPIDVLEHLERPGQPDHQDEVAGRLSTRDALTALGRRQRACLHLRYVEGLDTREIAAVLGCGESTVRSQTARGLSRMREALEEPVEPDDDHTNGRSDR